MACAVRPRLHLTPPLARIEHAPVIPAARFSWMKTGVITGMISLCAAFWSALFGAVVAFV